MIRSLECKNANKSLFYVICFVIDFLCPACTLRLSLKWKHVTVIRSYVHLRLMIIDAQTFSMLAVQPYWKVTNDKAAGGVYQPLGQNYLLHLLVQNVFHPLEKPCSSKLGFVLLVFYLLLIFGELLVTEISVLAIKLL